jgi:ankyrin repeat protein
MILATEKGYTDIIDLLVKNRAEVNAISKISGKTALMIGYNFIIYFIKSKVSIVYLILACETGNLDVIMKLLDLGADVNIAAENGTTALMIGNLRRTRF